MCVFTLRLNNIVPKEQENTEARKAIHCILEKKKKIKISIDFITQETIVGNAETACWAGHFKDGFLLIEVPLVAFPLSLKAKFNYPSEIPGTKATKIMRNSGSCCLMPPS